MNYVDENGLVKKVLTHTSIRTSDMGRPIDFHTRIMWLKLMSRHETRQNNAETAFLQDSEMKGAKLEWTFSSSLSSLDFATKLVLTILST